MQTPHTNAYATSEIVYHSENVHNQEIATGVLENGGKVDGKNFEMVARVAPSDQGNSENKKAKAEKVQFSDLFRYASFGDKALMLVSSICAMMVGCVFPLFTIIFGQVLDVLNNPATATDVSSQAQKIRELCVWFMIIAAVSAVGSAVENYIPVCVAERIIFRVRHEYMRSLLRQNMGWYDTNRSGEATGNLAEGTMAMCSGIEKVCSILKTFCTACCGIIVGFTTSWKLSLVILGCAPGFAIALGILLVGMSRSQAKSQKAYARAGEVATEVYSLIRTVAAYSGEKHEVERYDKFLEDAEIAGVRKGLAQGFSVGLMLFSFYGTYGVSTWAGAEFVIQSNEANPACMTDYNTPDCFTGGMVIQTFMAVLLGAFSFGTVGPLFGALGAAQASAASLYNIIDRIPPMDVYEKSGHSATIRGKVEFRNCTFSYPSRPDTVVLKHFSLIIEAGQTVALVGQSGSGKSTIVGLLERFYDLVEGEVLVDDVPVKDWNVENLRDQLGLVQQDPLLFGISVLENIAMGSPEFNRSVQVTGSLEVSQSIEARAVEAAKAANAHEFIMKLPEQYHTAAGTSVSCTQLSGGQRQRICIARAILRDPRILLLDEATSALDTESERIVQESLDKLLYNDTQTKRCTTIMIAHRLSTVTRADKIVVLDKGAVVEVGTHTELMSNENSLYKAMHSVQEFAQEQNKSTVTSVPVTTIPSTIEELESRSPTKAVAQDDCADEAPKKEGEHNEKIMMKEAKEFAPVAVSRLWNLQKEDWYWAIIAFFTYCGAGASRPIFSIIYSSMITVYFEPDNDDMRTKARQYLGWFFVLGVGIFFCAFVGIASSTYLGERLTRKLRRLFFTSTLRQPMAFFDDPRNSVGRLTTRLATDATLVKGATGDSLGTMVQGFACLICAFVISFDASPKLAGVMMCIFPFLILASVFEYEHFTQQAKGSATVIERSGEIVSDAVIAVRTVASFNLQNQILKLFDDSLVFPLKEGIKRARVMGIASGFKQFVFISAYALAFYVGAAFIEDGTLQFSQLIRVFLAVTLTSEAIGRITSQAPDSARAQAAARSIFHVVDLPTGTSDPLDDTFGVKPSSPMQGCIEFRGVSFAYPSRPDNQVLQDFNLRVEPGQTVAIVGESGSGKSTIVQLLERFYQASVGEVTVDGMPIDSYNVAWLRSNLGLVQQEPVLFADSIAYNVGYGTKGTDKPKPCEGAPIEDEAVSPAGKLSDVIAPGGGQSACPQAPSSFPPPSESVTQAAKDANAHEFAAGFQYGYATHCGARGGQLSGGQKQRVAIARAVVRNPRVLLLDEATSALDTNSEQVVQEALSRLVADGAGAAGGQRRTTLVIAHRLSTVQKADKIVVLNRGRKVEEGTHADLIARPDGAYRKLALAQPFAA